jgi:hypothetical protein
LPGFNRNAANSAALADDIIGAGCTGGGDGGSITDSSVFRDSFFAVVGVTKPKSDVTPEITVPANVGGVFIMNGSAGEDVSATGAFDFASALRTGPINTICENSAHTDTTVISLIRMAGLTCEFRDMWSFSYWELNY